MEPQFDEAQCKEVVGITNGTLCLSKGRVYEKESRKHFVSPLALRYIGVSLSLFAMFLSEKENNNNSKEKDERKQHYYNNNNNNNNNNNEEGLLLAVALGSLRNKKRPSFPTQLPTRTGSNASSYLSKVV